VVHEMTDRQSRAGTIPKLEFVDGKATMITRPITGEDLSGGSLAFLMGAGVHHIDQLQDISNNSQERMRKRK